ncbi:MAG: glycoside hydrolase family 43 protein [Solobacterium sp.]|nr:glycoside hydrolase family 43 protein [Solobacterium sp.]
MPYLNPILPGFYPDPSVCRKGYAYYLVNSSFEYFPGVPLWHSTDLKSWTQAGHVLTEDSQLELENCPASAGVFAPTIREHDGRFYMVTTNVNWFPKGTPNFLVWTDDISQRWSDPVPIQHMGIDPSLFFDDDGKAYYTGTGFDENGRQGIVLFQIDVSDGAVLSEKKHIWYGSGGRNPEGPHLYKKDGMYYLIIAEGGTEYGHMVTCARSSSVWGPYENCPYNPILSHRDHDKSSFQCVGHADLVETENGKWYAVFHAVRPSAAQLHHIGRETMLAEVTWKDGWPLIHDKEEIHAVMPDERDCMSAFDSTFTELFETVHPRWAWLRNPHMENYQFGSGLTMQGTEVSLDETASPSWIGVRQTQMELDCSTAIRITGTGSCGLSVYHTNEHHYDLCACVKDQGISVTLRRRVSDMAVRSEEHFFPAADQVVMKIHAEREQYAFYAGKDEAHLDVIGTGSTQLLSTEVMKGTFTGCFFALFAEGDSTAHFPYFKVTESEEQKRKNRADAQREYPV